MIDNHIFTIGNLKIEAAKGWLDVTEEIEDENPPFTLAKNDGFGVLQFTVASYRDGKSPQTSIEDLRKLMEDFSQSRELGRGFAENQQSIPFMRVGKTFEYATTFLRVWYCSDGKDVILATYLCKKGDEQPELGDVEQMIERLQFQTRQP